MLNPQTLVCSNQPKNPEGKFTTVGIYFIVYVSNVYFLYATSIRYKPAPVEFDEIYGWITNNVDAILEQSFPQYYIVRVVAYTFFSTKKKPKVIVYG